ncbi:NUDIX hydrolase [Paracoccus caeni]|uniref:NUDIX hydrolase n=1 Tax=Paracoccus caeni TaxID=657651 RepID=A0A934SB23_9RHOB|nr:NUDIX hydrolase [Paracoccus caeni]MBK4214448.1 NUDIX hydrolase [Paracoccus caeni]
MNAFCRSLGLLLGRRPASMQVAALCIDPETLKVMLVTSRGTGRWVTPKGWPMEGKTLSGAAAREAWEEAGVHGLISREEIGRYDYAKDQDRGFSVPVEVRVFPLYVTEAYADFPEAPERERNWFDAAEAADLVAEPGLKRILRLLDKRGRDGLLARFPLDSMHPTSHAAG